VWQRGGPIKTFSQLTRHDILNLSQCQHQFLQILRSIFPANLHSRCIISPIVFKPWTSSLHDSEPIKPLHYKFPKLVHVRSLGVHFLSVFTGSSNVLSFQVVNPSPYHTSRPDVESPTLGSFCAPEKMLRRLTGEFWLGNLYTDLVFHR